MESCGREGRENGGRAREGGTKVWMTSKQSVTDHLSVRDWRDLIYCIFNIYYGRVRLGSIRNKNNWNNAS